MGDVALKSVTKRHRDAVAVNDVSIHVRDGEFFVILGPSGCGKSTLLMLIAGFDAPDAGEIRIAGRVVNDVDPKDRNVAIVFQSYALYPHLSVRDNIAFPLRIAKRDTTMINERVAWAAGLLGLDALLDRKPHALSGGQRQRVAMGRALVREPAAFLLDEPLANLDSRLRHQMRAELASIHRTVGATMLYVTHDQVEALTLADRIAVMRAGQVVQIGTPRDVYEAPRSLFVARFLGAPPMNLVPGRLDGTHLALPFGDLAVRAIAPTGNGSREVVVGIRPEHVDIGDGSANRTWPMLRAQVAAVEWTGADLFVSLTPEVKRSFERGPHPAIEDYSADFVTRWPKASAPARGESVVVQFAPDRLYLFDAATGERLDVTVVAASA
jgi:multiple sugar transport system ATP-binding protein